MGVEIGALFLQIHPDIIALPLSGNGAVDISDIF